MVMGVAVGMGVGGSVGGLAINWRWRFLPSGPAIVLVLFVLFLVGYVASRSRGAAAE